MGRWRERTGQSDRLRTTLWWWCGCTSMGPGLGLAGWEGEGHGDGLLPEEQHCSAGLYGRDGDIHDRFTMQKLYALKWHVKLRLFGEEKMSSLLTEGQFQKVLQHHCGEFTGQVGARTGRWSC